MHLQNIDKIKAFTLVELIIIITLIGILAVGASRLNISRLSQNQKIAIEITQIEIIFEEIRNNAFLGKGVSNPIQNPDNWQIHISQNNGGEIASYYQIDGNITPYSTGNWISGEAREIRTLQCQNYDTSSMRDITGVGILTFDGAGISLDQCEDFQKILYIEYGDSDFSRELIFNMLTGTLTRN